MTVHVNTAIIRDSKTPIANFFCKKDEEFLQAVWVFEIADSILSTCTIRHLVAICAPQCFDVLQVRVHQFSIRLQHILD